MPGAVRRSRIATLLLAIACGFAGCDIDHRAPPVYDDNTAFTLVGQEVPASERDYYLFDFNQRLSVDANAQELLDSMRNNPLNSAYMGIVGADATRTVAVMQAVMAARDDDEFPKVHLIYVGPAGQEQRVRNLLAPLHATLHYVVYP